MKILRVVLMLFTLDLFARRETWRSAFPFPSLLLRPSYFLPTFTKFPSVNENLCKLEKNVLFLFRVRAPATALSSQSEYIVGGIREDTSKNHMEQLPCPLQCSVKVKVQGYDKTLINTLDCQILPLGYEYRMTCWDSKDWQKHYRGVAFLELNKEEGEFVVLLAYKYNLLVLKSGEMKWIRIRRIPMYPCKEVVTFRGRFYALFPQGEVFLIDHYLMRAFLTRPTNDLSLDTYLVASGNDELFLVETFLPVPSDYGRFTCRVSRRDEETAKWVEVSELGDRVLVIGLFRNVCCSAKEFLDDCGVTGNSILFSNEPGLETFAYKYGVDTGRAEDELDVWRYSRVNRVIVLDTSPSVAPLVDQ